MLRTISVVMGAVVLSVAGALAATATETPTVVKALFESRHLDQINKGSEVTYRFERKVSDTKLLGEGFQDDIKLGVVKVGAQGEREVVFKVFTGDKARDPSNWPDLTINPIFIWYLDRAVGTFSSLAGGNHAYLKGKFRDALGDKAVLESTKFAYNGKEVDAYKMTVRPYADDVNSSKMQGYERANFTVIVSQEVPGYFLDMVSTFESSKAGGPKLEEHISLVGLGEAK